MWSHRARIVVMVAVGTLVSALAAQAQEKPQASPHIQTALTFLTAWGNQRWDELKTVAAVQVTVKVGDKAFTLEPAAQKARSEEHTSELQSQSNLVCRLLLEKKKKR